MENEQRFKLIAGTFTGAEAAHVLLSLVQAKMNFHHLERASNVERFGRDVADSERRLAELTRLRAELKAICETAAAREQSLKINGWIEIEAV